MLYNYAMYRRAISEAPDTQSLIKDYLSAAKMMQLATVSDGKPWTCNVWFAADKNLNIYWFSARTRRHSKEVEACPNVSAAICLPQSPSDTVARGLQLEGTAERLTNAVDIATAMKSYVGKIFSLTQVKRLAELADRPHSFYRIKPSLFVLFDTGSFPDDSRQEYRP